MTKLIRTTTASSATAASPPPAPPASATGSAATRTAARAGRRFLGAYFALGVVLGIVALKTELVSWFRIQEMFRFQAFHMYGILGSAVAVVAASIALLRRLGVRMFEGEPIRIQAKVMGPGTRYWAGGTLFGAGWVLTGACPGPFYVMIGSGLGIFAVILASAVAGMWTYGHLRPRLPH